MSEAAVVIVGAGGHAAVVADALLASGRRVLGFTDRDAGLRGRTIGRVPVLGGDEALADFDPGSVVLANGLGGVALGAAAVREAVQRRLEALGWQFATVLHPSAIVSSSAGIGPGVQILAGAVVQAGAHVGDGAIVNTRSVVEHDCRVGPFSHVAPGAILCGNVILGNRVHVGAGSVIRQGLNITDEVIIGIAAAVVRDCVEPGTYVGVPARIVGGAQ